MSLKDFKKALSRTDEVELTVAGRASGRETSRPVWFVEDGDTLYLLPVKGSDSAWFKNVLNNPTIRLAAGGTSVTATARPITDPRRVGDVVERFRAKYGANEVKKYYSKLDVAVDVPLS
jgi:deazaflavin-dependent oxidoreductase (nitroreductase family)